MFCTWDINKWINKKIIKTKWINAQLNLAKATRNYICIVDLYNLTFFLKSLTTKMYNKKNYSIIQHFNTKNHNTLRSFKQLPTSLQKLKKRTYGIQNKWFKQQGQLCNLARSSHNWLLLFYSQLFSSATCLYFIYVIKLFELN